MAYTVKITSRYEREEMIKKRLELSDSFGETIFNFRSGSYSPKVVSLPIDVPVYRMENCRTFSAQQTEIARQGRPKDFFEKGQELTTAQQAQHDILEKLANQGTDSVTPIINILKDEGQRQEILITSTGTVVNGNRRLSAMRELVKGKDGSVDERFTNIRCAVLPADVTRDEIDDIEADLQARPQTKLDYDWIGDAHLVRRQVEKDDRTTKQVADRLRRSRVDIENVLQALDEADLYLNDWIKKPGEYDLVADGQQIFGDIPKAIANKDGNLQDASRAIAWSIYENRNKITGRLYSLNAAFGKLAPKVLEILDDQLELPDKCDGEAVDSDTDDFAIDIGTDESADDYRRVIEALRDGAAKEETISTLIDACESAIELDKGLKNEKSAIRALVRANAKITSIDVNMAGKKTLPAMLKQIESIRKGVDDIEAIIIKRQEQKCSDGNSEE